MKQMNISPFEMDAIKEMCNNMIFAANNHPDYNHLGVAGLFIDGDMRNYHYAMIYIMCRSMSDKQLDDFVNLCNSKRKGYKSALDGRMHLYADRAFSNKEMMKFVTVASGECCDIHTRKLIKAYL